MAFYCNICSKSFATIQALKSHERSNIHTLKILQKKISQQDVNIISEEITDKRKNEFDEFNVLNSSDETPLLEDLMDMEYNNIDSFQEEVIK